MRILVCGGRDYNDGKMLFRTLSSLLKHDESLTIIEGGARGADRLAATWAEAMQETHPTVQHLRFAADWRKHGRGAGPIRNQRMLDDGKPDLVVAFPGGKGTADMIRRAAAAKVPVMTVPEAAHD